MTSPGGDLGVGGRRWGLCGEWRCYLVQCYHSGTVSKKDHIPSRRTGKIPLGAKVFSYYTQEERRLIEKAAKLEHRSLSSFVAIAAIDRAQRVLGRT